MTKMDKEDFFTCNYRYKKYPEDSETWSIDVECKISGLLVPEINPQLGNNKHYVLTNNFRRDSDHFIDSLRAALRSSFNFYSEKKI